MKVFLDTQKTALIYFGLQPFKACVNDRNCGQRFEANLVLGSDTDLCCPQSYPGPAPLSLRLSAPGIPEIHTATPSLSGRRWGRVRWIGRQEAKRDSAANVSHLSNCCCPPACWAWPSGETWSWNLKDKCRVFVDSRHIFFTRRTTVECLGPQTGLWCYWQHGMWQDETQTPEWIPSCSGDGWSLDGLPMLDPPNTNTLHSLS